MAKYRWGVGGGSVAEDTYIPQIWIYIHTSSDPPPTLDSALGTYEKFSPVYPDKLLRKKGPGQELERTTIYALFAQISLWEK